MKEKEKLMYRVLLVDDEEMLLDSLEIILSLNDMEIVGKAHDGNECLKLLKDVSCDIALVDLNMKGMGGIELIGHLKKKYPGIRILVLTTFYDDGNITEAISNGADGYLLKDSDSQSPLIHDAEFSVDRTPAVNWLCPFFQDLHRRQIQGFKQCCRIGEYTSLTIQFLVGTVKALNGVCIIFN